jgi:membrane protein YqaA with SNARE-associated domain
VRGPPPALPDNVVMDDGFSPVLHWLALPHNGLPALFLVALVSATLLPLGSEPALVGLLQLDPSLFWWAVAVATVGNTAGGAITWATGRYAQRAWSRVAHRQPLEARHPRLARWVHRWGAAACLLGWLPVVGDPLCAVAGWLRVPFWPCVAFMALGKGARYLAVASLARAALH